MFSKIMKNKELNKMITFRLKKYFTSDGQDLEDLIQIAYIAIWEKSQENSDFMNQSNSYIATFAAWKAGNQASNERTYQNKTQNDSELTYEDQENDSTYMETLIDCSMNPEDIICRKETNLENIIEKHLTNENTLIAFNLTEKKKSEIAKDLKVSNGTISNRIKLIRKKLDGMIDPETFQTKRIVTLKRDSRLKFTDKFDLPVYENENEIRFPKAAAAAA